MTYNDTVGAFNFTCMMALLAMLVSGELTPALIAATSCDAAITLTYIACVAWRRRGA